MSDGQPCRQCNGSGWAPDYAATGFAEPDAETPCWVCGGSGVAPEDQEGDGSD